MVARTERDVERAIAAAAKEMTVDEARADKSRMRWEKLVHDGNVNYGITYERIAELSKKSRSRIDQVLAKIRRRKAESNHASV